MPMKKFWFVLVILVSLLSQQVWAAPLDSSLLAPTPSVQISSIRYAVHTDSATGGKSLRVVLDVNGPVKVTASSNMLQDPQLVITIQGASVGSVANSVVFDGSIAKDLTILQTGKTESQITVNLPQIIDDSDYQVSVLPGDTAANKPFRVVIDIDKPLPLPEFTFTPGLRGKRIAIDPGHGGSDVGAIGPNGIQEKVVTLGVAMKVKALLEQAGAKVYMTRTDDRDVFAPNDTASEELGARSEVGNKNQVDIFVDIHANSFANPQVGGTGTYYFKKSMYDKLLAKTIQNGVCGVYGLADRGIYPANFYVLKHTNMPAILIEMAFLSNPNEEKLLAAPAFQQQMAQGIVSGIDNFFTQAAKLGVSN